MPPLLLSSDPVVVVSHHLFAVARLREKFRCRSRLDLADPADFASFPLLVDSLNLSRLVLVAHDSVDPGGSPQVDSADPADSGHPVGQSFGYRSLSDRSPVQGPDLDLETAEGAVPAGASGHIPGFSLHRRHSD